MAALTVVSALAAPLHLNGHAQPPVHRAHTVGPL